MIMSFAELVTTWCKTRDSGWTWFLDNAGMLVLIVSDSWARCEELWGVQLTTISLPEKYGDICLSAWLTWTRPAPQILVRQLGWLVCLPFQCQPWYNDIISNHHQPHHQMVSWADLMLYHCPRIETVLIVCTVTEYGLRQGSESEVSAHFLI